MVLARVEGSVTATRKHPSFQGWRLLLCQPIGLDEQPQGAPLVAIDSYGAGMHQKVIISSDGLTARTMVGDNFSPARMIVIGVLDRIDNREEAA